jgi:uncharacterized protein YcbK (DUF882 family)
MAISFKYFKLEEFSCRHTGKNEMDLRFIERLDILRAKCGFSFTITSGYRDPSHPEEAKKAKPGTHSQGIAADIQITNGADRHKIVQEALLLGFTGIGVAKTFVHVDLRDTTPVLWTY